MTVEDAVIAGFYGGTAGPLEKEGVINSRPGATAVRVKIRNMLTAYHSRLSTIFAVLEICFTCAVMESETSP